MPGKEIMPVKEDLIYNKRDAVFTASLFINIYFSCLPYLFAGRFLLCLPQVAKEKQH